MTMEHDLRQAALLQAKNALMTAQSWLEYASDDERAEVAAALSAIEAVQEKGEKGNLVHRSAADLPAASGSDVPARPTSPAEDAK